LALEIFVIPGWEAPQVLATVQRRSISRTSLFRTRAEMRRAIILMTILGPCRAAEASKEQLDLSM
jgi:hypothetical protein